MPATMERTKAKKGKKGTTKRGTARGETVAPIFSKAQWATLKTYESYFSGLTPGGKADGLGAAILSCIGMEANESLNVSQIADRINQDRRAVSQRIKRLVRHKLLAPVSGGLFALTESGAVLWEVLEPKIE